MSESKDRDSTSQRSSSATHSAAAAAAATEEDEQQSDSSSYKSAELSDSVLTDSSMVVGDESTTDPSSKTAEDAAEGGSAEQPSDAGSADTGKAGDDDQSGEQSGDSGNGENETGSEEAASTTDENPTSDLESETMSTPGPGFKDPGKMVSRALEYDLQDMYPEITLLFEDKQSAWNCQDPATIRAIWMESRTNILREWKLRNGRIRATEKPKIEVKPNMAMTLRKQLLDDKAKLIDWKEMYIPPGNNAPKYKALTLPTNKTTEVRYNFNRNNPPVPSAYVLHYEKYRRPPFNVYQPQACVVMFRE